VYHDLNNSLSVIYGNTQLLSEMARADDLGAAFAEPLEDIEAARAELSDTLEEIDDMRRETKAGDS
jgi:signal transduction histidine kinase